MINTYACDSDIVALERIKRMLKELADENQLEIHIKGFACGEIMIDAFKKERDMVDIVYSEVMVGDTSGIEIEKQMQELGYRGEIIFIAPDETHILESFKVGPRGYIVKGKEGQEEFKRSFMDVVDRTRSKPTECLVCGKGGYIKRILLKDIQFIEVQGRVSKIHYRNGVFDVSLGLSVFDEQLKEKNFIRINRSFLVNLRYISDVMDKSVILTSGQELPIGRSHLSNVRNKVPEYSWEHYQACYGV